jgi:hypothetical protein
MKIDWLFFVDFTSHWLEPYWRNEDYDLKASLTALPLSGRAQGGPFAAACWADSTAHQEAVPDKGQPREMDDLGGHE